MKTAVLITLPVVAIYLVSCLFLFIVQRRMIYFPTPPVTVPASEAQTMIFSHAGQSLKVLHIEGTGNRTLLYFGGNAEEVALNIPQFKKLFPKYSIYLFNYRGYGGSTGMPSEAALFSDAVAFYDHLHGNHRDIAVMGRSLGTGVAVYLASQRKAELLILVTPFASMTSLAQHHYPFFPVSLLLKDRYDSERRAMDLKVPTLVLLAENDEVVPRKNSERLVAAMDPHLTEKVVIPHAGHNTISDYPLYAQALQKFAANKSVLNK